MLSYTGDAMLMRSPVMMDAWFHYRETAGKPVKEVRDPWLNERVLSYGRASNYEHSGTVSSLSSIKSATQNGVTTTIGNLVEVDHSMTFGDSGGPLYGGNTAMGLLSNMNREGTLAYYKKIKTVENTLRLTVCKDPVCS
ncbi:hypothetical protein [Cryobacterium sp. SO1]|uniref:hypothetical protein n=1 Tax=Cryobacterium sp. SO1 TaxID=1897061 RepID=UPI0010234305|nr:hypothetical protein [Cryobacterium sp. SO1]